MALCPMEVRTLGSILVLASCVALGGCSEPMETPHTHEHAAEHDHDGDHDHDHDPRDHDAARGDHDDPAGHADHTDPEHDADDSHATHDDHSDDVSVDVASAQESRRLVAELKAAAADGKLSEEQLTKVRLHIERLESQLDRLDRAVEKQEQKKDGGHDDHDH